MRRVIPLFLLITILSACQDDGPTEPDPLPEIRLTLSAGATLTPEWVRTSNPSSGNDVLGSVTCDADGNYVAAGRDYAADQFGQWRVEKIDAYGGLVWTYTSNPGFYDGASDVVIDVEGNYVVAGTERRFGGWRGGNYGWRVEKLSPGGTVLWVYTHNPTGIDDYVDGLAVDHQGNYVVVGDEYSVYESNVRIRVEKLDPGGSLIWSYVSDPTTGYDRSSSVAIDAGGNYVVAGYDEPSDANNFRWRIEKLDPGGTRTWEYTSDPVNDTPLGDKGDKALAVAVDANGDYVVAGTDLVPGDGQWRVEKLAPSGALLWTYVSDPSSGDDYPRSVAIDADGGYLVAGWDRVEGDPRWRIEKLSQDGELLWVFTDYPGAGGGYLYSMAVCPDGSRVASGVDYTNGDGQCRVVKYGPSVIPVTIDVKPGSDPNSINCNNPEEVITVAILTTDNFDATTVDHTTVTFEGATEAHLSNKTFEARRHEEDVDLDGDTDLVLHLRRGATSLTCSSTEGTLTGETIGAEQIEGTDAVRMIDEGGGQ